MTSYASGRRAGSTDDADFAPPSPRAAVFGILLILAAVFLAATRVVGEVAPLEVDIFRTSSGWQVGPDPAAARVTVPAGRKDGLDCAFQAPAGARGEELVIDVVHVGAQEPERLPGAPIQAGWNTVPLEGASRFLSVHLGNALFRWPRPAVALVRGGPARPSDPPGDVAVFGALMAALLASLGIGTVAGPRPLLRLGFVLLLAASALAFANENSGLRLFLSWPAATALAALPALVALAAGRIARKRLERREMGAGALPSMGGGRL